jgi:hypothetical protein
MRLFLSIAALFFVAAAPPASTLSSGKARAIVEKAVRAHGGRENLKKRDRYYWRGEGTASNGQREAEARCQCWVSLPDSGGRMVNDYRTRGGSWESNIMVETKTRFWRSTNGFTTESPKNQGVGLDLATYTYLLPLLDDPTIRLTALPDTKVDGRFASGVRVTCTGRASASLYFDRDNHFLVMLEVQSYNRAGEGALSRVYLSDYKRVQGVYWPMRRVQVSGPFTSTIRVKEIKFLNKIDSSKFDKP